MSLRFRKRVTLLPGVSQVTLWTAEIDVARNRHGVPGGLRLGFRPEHAGFESRG